jgi:hypothetical protein
MAYRKDAGYTYMEVRSLIRISEGRGSLFTGGGAHGHASAQHQAINNPGLIGRLKMLPVASAFKDTAATNFGGTLKTEDQAFLLTEILNSKLGRAALQAFDTAAGGGISRLSICYLVGNTSAFSLREARLQIPAGVSKNAAKMNLAKYGVVDSSTPMEQILSVFDSGYPDLQIVTCYPGSQADVTAYGNHGGYKIETVGGPETVVKWTA